MTKKIFFTFLLISLLFFSISYSFATTNVGNDLMSAGKNVGNAVKGTADAAIDGARDLTNGASNMMNDMTNANGDKESDATNTLATTDGIFDNAGRDYTAMRTSTTDNNLLGMSEMAWTWLILGIVGAVIVALVWYYGAQYEHRNYND